MKKTSLFFLGLGILILSLINTNATAQSGTPKYKEVLGENPNADADVKAVTDYLNAVVAGDISKVKNVLSPDFKGYGPGPLDSVDAAKEVASWEQAYKDQQNRKFNFVCQTFRVLQGDLKGTWVSVWGDYSFSMNGKTATFPVQLTAKVNKGKIEVIRTYYDRLYIMETMGMKLVQASN